MRPVRVCEIGGQKVTSLAFADDLVLISDSWNGMAHNLWILEKFTDMTGLKGNPKKCHGFLLSQNRSTYEVNNCASWAIGAAPIRMVGPGESVRYLGVQVGPAKGITATNISK